MDSEVTKTAKDKDVRIHSPKRALRPKHHADHGDDSGHRSEPDTHDKVGTVGSEHEVEVVHEPGTPAAAGEAGDINPTRSPMSKRTERHDSVLSADDKSTESEASVDEDTTSEDNPTKKKGHAKKKEPKRKKKQKKKKPPCRTVIAGPDFRTCMQKREQTNTKLPASLYCFVENRMEKPEIQILCESYIMDKLDTAQPQGVNRRTEPIKNACYILEQNLEEHGTNNLSAKQETENCKALRLSDDMPWNDHTRGKKMCLVMSFTIEHITEKLQKLREGKQIIIMT